MPELDEVREISRQLSADRNLLHALRRLGADKAAAELQKLIDESERLRAELSASGIHLRTIK